MLRILWLVPAAVLLLELLMALAAPYLPIHDPAAIHLRDRLLPPFWMQGTATAFPLGTDSLGRDLWARIVFGARVSLTVGVFATAISVVIGVPLGIVAAYFRGPIDAVLMRLADLQLAFPFILLAISIMALLGTGLVHMTLVLGLSGWVVFGRVIRASTLVVKEADYVTASRAIGASTPWILYRHILPNVVGSAIVLASFAVGANMLSEAALSFLGLGVDPQTPSWGSMVSESRPYFESAWWWPVLPGLFLSASVGAVNVLGDLLRTKLDPRMKDVI